MQNVVLAGLLCATVVVAPADAQGQLKLQANQGGTTTTEAQGPPAADGGDQEIVVTADRRGTFGADFVQAGTFRDARLIDTPLTVAIQTKALLEAQQAQSIIDAVRNTPGVTQAQINTSIYSNLAIRGIILNNFTNVRWNGVLPVVNLIEQPIESKDRIEVLKGAAGLYYGFATPSGILNLVTERPTAVPVTQVEVHADSNGSIGGNVDAVVVSAMSARG